MPTLKGGTSSRKKDGMARVLAKIQAGRPKTEAEGTFDVTRTNKDILSRVKFVLKTGIRPIDDPVGGIPFGRVTEVYGPEACGKTAMVIRCAIQANLKNIWEVGEDVMDMKRIKASEYDVNVLYVDNEQSLTDDEKIEIDGVRLDAVLARCDTVDQLFKMMDLTIDELEAYEKDCERPQLIVVIVDTIAGTASKQEMTDDWGKQDYNRQPKELRKGFRGLMRRLARRNVAVICTNQISDSFKPKVTSRGKTMIPQDDDYSTFGGKALKFYSRLRIFMYKLRSFKFSKHSRFPDGFVSGFTTTKNGQRKPLREGRFVLLYEGGMSEVYSILEQLCLIKTVAERGEKGVITFKYLQNGITPTTYGTVAAANSTTLEADDKAEQAEEGGGKKKSYKFTGEPREWPAYYTEHKDDIEALYAVHQKKLFTCDGQTVEGEEDDEGESDGINLSEDDDDLL